MLQSLLAALFLSTSAFAACPDCRLANTLINCPDCKTPEATAPKEEKTLPLAACPDCKGPNCPDCKATEEEPALDIALITN